MNKADTISELESELLCDSLREFVEAMREDVDATDDEIEQSVLKELRHYLKRG
jgi:hypothetical protein|tara:strand:+ start:1059 stop:1217 length:159 start_codon:yes stop_codon:yes gene_type:complete